MRCCYIENRLQIGSDSRFDRVTGGLAGEERFPDDRVFDEVDDVGRAAPEVSARRLLELLAQQLPGPFLIQAIALDVSSLQIVGDYSFDRVADCEPVAPSLDE